MMKLLGGPISPFVRKVGIALLEKGLDSRVECVRASAMMIKANESLMQFNPLSKIPVLLTDDGAPLYDSDVICEYLDESFAGGIRLIPPVGTARWRSLCWTALASGMLDALVLWRFERNRPPEQSSQPTLTTYQTKIRHCLARVEELLPEIEATEFDLAHITFGVVFGYMDYRFSDYGWRNGHARCARWYESFMQRDSSRRTVPFEDANFQPGVTCGELEHLWPVVVAPVR